MVTREFEGAVCTNGFRILRPKECVNPYYLLYYLRTQYFLRQVFQYRTGAAIPAISDEDLEKVLVYIPPKHSQDAIAGKVMKGFELRHESKRLVQDIRFSLV
jgi:restriction endonuclease S subunit